jgi:hypothetical protein
MMENVIRHKDDHQEVKPKRQGKITGFIAKKLNLEKDLIQNAIPFVMYLTLWAIIYIGNTHYAERSKRNIDRINKEIKELRADYLTTKADLMFRSKQSEVAKMVSQTGLKELTTPPKKINIRK